jgi:pimeloyl-ACP methyl ester carboxylesterase
MGYGRNIDRVVGGFSRLLHVRPARQNTLPDLERHYLDLPIDRMFPAAEAPRDVRITRNLLDRAIRSSTVTWRSTHEVLCPHYRRRHETDYAKNLDAQLRWVRPDGVRRRDCLVYVHGWLEPGSWAEETTLFRAWGRELDVDLAHVSLPFHGVRKPPGSLFSGELFWTADLVRSVEGVRQAVHDARSAIAYLRAQGYERVGVSGLSLGGAVVMILACLEPSLDFVIPIISHLQLLDAVEEAPILWRVKHDLNRWGVDRAARARIFDRLGWSAYAPAVPKERQLWIQAREDVYIDARAVERQWRQWDEPPILWVDGGHMTFALKIGEINARIKAFLAR